MHSVGWFYTIYIEKVFISKLHLIHCRNFPPVALQALPVEVPRKPCIPALSSGCPLPFLAWAKFLFPSQRTAARDPFSPSLGQLVPMDKCETWVIWIAGETTAAFNLSWGQGFAAMGWQCSSEDGYWQTLAAVGWLYSRIEKIAQVSVLPQVIPCICPCQLIWLWKFAWLCLPRGETSCLSYVLERGLINFPPSSVFSAWILCLYVPFGML